MYLLTITDEYNDNFKLCTDKENDHININIKYLLLTVPSSVLLLSIISLNIWTSLKL